MSLGVKARMYEAVVRATFCDLQFKEVVQPLHQRRAGRDRVRVEAFAVDPLAALTLRALRLRRKRRPARPHQHNATTSTRHTRNKCSTGTCSDGRCGSGAGSAANGRGLKACGFVAFWRCGLVALWPCGA